MFKNLLLSLFISQSEKLNKGKKLNEHDPFRVLLSSRTLNIATVYLLGLFLLFSRQGKTHCIEQASLYVGKQICIEQKGMKKNQKKFWGLIFILKNQYFHSINLNPYSR